MRRGKGSAGAAVIAAAYAAWAGALFAQQAAPAASATPPHPLRPEEIQLITAGKTPSPAATPTAALAAPARAEKDPREVFAYANSLYQAGDYKGALAEYEMLVSRGYASGNLYYNIGNTYFKLDRKSEAILYYMKALRLQPRDQDVKANLEYARSLLPERLENPPRFWLLRYWDNAADSFTLNELRAAAMAAYWVLAAVVIAIIYLRGVRPYLWRAGVVVFLLLLVVCGGMISRARLEHREQAVILPQEVKVRYGPSDKDVIAFILHEGAAVDVAGVKDGWYLISLPDGKSGWIRKEACGVV